MSYNQTMFKRIVEELARIGNEVANESHEQFDRGDIANALDAIKKLVGEHDGLDFCISFTYDALNVAVNTLYYGCPIDSDELQLADFLMDDLGYTNIHTDSYDIFLKNLED